MYSKLAACCHCAPNVCGDCLCFRSNKKTMPAMSPMLATRLAMFASHPVNATMILPYYHATILPCAQGTCPLPPPPLSHCRSNFLPYSHCSGGGYILYGGGIYYLDNRYGGGQYYQDNRYRGYVLYGGYILDVTPAVVIGQVPWPETGSGHWPGLTPVISSTRQSE